MSTRLDEWNSSTIFIFWMGIAVIGLSAFMSYHAGVERGIALHRIEAVKAGHAQWVPDKTGKVSFSWVGRSLKDTPKKPAK